jgi:hypothetical protein
MVALLVGGVALWLLLFQIEDRSSLQPFSRIEDNLYVGGVVKAPPAGTDAVVNLCEQKDRYKTSVHLWKPTDGSKAPSIDWLREVVTFIEKQRREGKTVYVHCLSGMNRSGMVVTAYLMHEHNWSRDEALAFAQSKRPQIQPNPTMMHLLAEWETKR